MSQNSGGTPHPDWSTVDEYFRHGEVVRPQSGGPAVEGVRQAVADIAAHPDLEATALQTVGLQGWDGFVIARRR